jgi:Predicted transcriptional regulators
MSNFSEKFKQLRKNNNVTQDEIADIFHVSPQAVSRWETGATYPDIEFLPHIAIYFKVTVDELLGTEIILGEEKAKEYIRDIRNMLNSGKVSEAIDAARKGTKDYPANEELQFLLFESLTTACNGDTPESKANIEKYKDEVLKIGSRIKENKFDFIRLLSKWGMKAEARKIVDTLPSGAYDTQDMTMKYVLDGEDLIKDLGLRIVRFAIMLSDFVSLYAEKADLNIMQKIECAKAVMQIEAIPSATGASDWVDTVARAHQNIGVAELYCEAGDSASALDYVKQATADALLHIGELYKTTESGGNYLPAATKRNLPWIMWEDHLAKPLFDIVRTNTAFIECFESLKSNSGELK